MPESSLRLRVLAVVVAAFIAVQLAVPTLALFGPRPARFGWHMYSALPALPTVAIVNADGFEEPVDLAALFAVQRAEIDYAAAVRHRLCHVAQAQAVRITVDGETQTIACSGSS